MTSPTSSGDRFFGELNGTFVLKDARTNEGCLEFKGPLQGLRLFPESGEFVIDTNVAKVSKTSDGRMLVGDTDGEHAILWPAEVEDDSASLCCHGSTEDNLEEASEMHDFLHEFVLRSLLHAEQTGWEDVVEDLFFKYNYLLHTVASFQTLLEHALAWSTEHLIEEDNYTTAAKTLRLALWLKFVKIPRMCGDSESDRAFNLLQYDKCMKKVFVAGYDGSMIIVLTKFLPCSCLDGLRGAYEEWTGLASCRVCLRDFPIEHMKKCFRCHRSYCSSQCHRDERPNHNFTCVEVSSFSSAGEVVRSVLGPARPRACGSSSLYPGFAQTYTKAPYPFSPAPPRLYEAPGVEAVPAYTIPPSASASFGAPSSGQVSPLSFSGAAGCRSMSPFSASTQESTGLSSGQFSIGAASESQPVSNFETSPAPLAFTTSSSREASGTQSCAFQMGFAPESQGPRRIVKARRPKA